MFAHETVPCVAGINSSNVLHCLWGSVTPTGHALDGFAVVSDIVASPQPLVAAQALFSRIQAFYQTSLSPQSSYTVESIKAGVGSILDSVRKYGPLVHQVCYLHERIPISGRS